MSDFDFLSSVTIGQYIPSGSLLHKVDARARILAYSVIILALVFIPGPVGLVMIALAALGGFAVGKIPLKYALRGLIPPLPFLLILAVLQIFINPYPESGRNLFQIGQMMITTSDLIYGLILLLRFLALILWISLATSTISTSEMIYGLQSIMKPLQKVGFPARDFVMVIQVMLRFLPFLGQAMERIAKAQASRGAEWGSGKGSIFERARRVVPLIVPLFLTSLRRAENLALAMDARAYGSRPYRSSLIEMKFTWKDGLFLAAACVLAGAAFLVRSG